MATKTLQSLKPNPKNPRKITDQKLAMLKDALAEFGDLGGVVFNTTSGQLVGGHQRAKAIPEYAEVTITSRHDKPTRAGTVAEGHVLWGGERYAYREVMWDAAKEKAANIAANKGAGEWDLPQLSGWLDELAADDFALDLTMFDDSEIEAILNPPLPAEQGEVVVEKIGTADIQDDEGVAPPAEPKSKRGDTYRLGRHLLYCADSTDHPAFAEKYDVVFTDPPYGVSYSHGRVDKNKRKDWGGIENDAMSDDELQQMVKSAVPPATHSFICCDWKAYLTFAMALGRPKAVCVWDKGHTSLGKGYRRQHEFLMFYGVLNRTDLSDVWPFKRATNYQHPTQKPVPMVAKALNDVANKGAKVYDPFGGSGSTLMAAEQLGMDATLIEYEPKYCDVIISRWEKLTGQVAELISNGAEMAEDA